MTALAHYRTWASTPLDVPPVFSVVIPAYNERERIVPTIGAIASHVSSLGQPWELIVADDGSTDDTVELVRGLGLANLVILEAERNGGKGSAVRRGVLAARGERILFADADQSTPIEQVGALLAALDQGSDIAIGSRSADGATVTNKSPLRKMLSSGLNLLIRLGFGLDIADTQCGFKMFTRDAAQRVFRRQLIDQFSFDLEILYLAKKFGLSVEEVPVDWIDAPGSTVDPVRVALGFLSDLAQIRWWDLQGRYRQDNHAAIELASIGDHS